MCSGVLPDEFQSGSISKTDASKVNQAEAVRVKGQIEEYFKSARGEQWLLRSCWKVVYNYDAYRSVISSLILSLSLHPL